jgi:cytochrome c oxidase assembly factor CtaG
MTTRELLLTAWEKDPFVICLCVAGLVAYAVHRRFALGKRALLFVVAALLFILALASPIGVLARGYLFSAHMLQHILLVLVVPPLVLLSLSSSATPSGTAPHPIRFLAPWVLGVGAMWFWHAPALCDAASQNLTVLRVQTVSLVVMGTAFWWPIVGPNRAHRLAPFAAMIYLFTACGACTILGVLVTFSPLEVCSVYAHPVDRLGALSLLRGWGLTPKADQEIGGLLMWVPGCLIYAGSIIAMYARYSRDEGDPAPQNISEPQPVPAMSVDRKPT